MYSIKRLRVWNIGGLLKVADILYKCGKDMCNRFKLNHWNNSHFKNWIIVLLCVLKNKIYLVYKENIPVATFQTRKVNSSFLFQKLATLPNYSGEGIGGFCLNIIEKKAKEKNCTEVVCEVYDKSEQAIKFYQHKGYQIYGTTDTLKYKELKLKKIIDKKEKKILIIGAGFLQNFVIQKANDMGYKTLTVDANPDAIGFKNADQYKVVNIIDEKACLEYAKAESIDGVLTVATDYGVLTASYIAKEMNLPGLNYEVAKLIKNKYEVRKRLYEHHIDDTEQVYEVDENYDLDELSKKVTFPVMVKPCDGSGSRGASRVDDASSFEKACQVAMDSSITHRAEIETFIIGKEYGAESLVVNGEIYVLGIMRKWMTAHPYYAELGHAIPTDLPVEVEEKARQCVKNAIKALGVNFGSVNMDMLITKEGKVHIIDVGARMGGNMIGPCIIPYGTGVDYIANMIKNAVGEKVELVEGKHGAVATRILAFSKGTVKTLPDFKDIERKYNVEIYHHLEVGQEVNEYHTNLDGCGYIIAKSENIEDAIKNVEQALEHIKKSIF